MKEERILFKVSAVDEGTSVAIGLESEDDEMPIALALHELYMKYPQIIQKVAFIAMLHAADKDNFEKIREKNTIHIPDFDKILKENK